MCQATRCRGRFRKRRIKPAKEFRTWQRCVVARYRKGRPDFARNSLALEVQDKSGFRECGNQGQWSSRHTADGIYAVVGACAQVAGIAVTGLGDSGCAPPRQPTTPASTRPTSAASNSGLGTPTSAPPGSTAWHHARGADSPLWSPATGGRVVLISYRLPVCWLP